MASGQTEEDSKGEERLGPKRRPVLFSHAKNVSPKRTHLTDELLSSTWATAFELGPRQWMLLAQQMGGETKAQRCEDAQASSQVLIQGSPGALLSPTSTLLLHH